ncbi:MAG: AMP-binding protein [Clostridia bacterium]|nr:AMP-binding protein [Clostridia bacterium]
MTRPFYKVREFHDLREILTQSAFLYGHSPAFKIKNEVGQILNVSYKHFQADVDALGTALFELGLEGKRIAIAGANSYKWCTSYLAVTGGVGVAVPTDKELPFSDIKSILEVSEASAIIFDSAFGEKLLEHRGELPDGILLISTDLKHDENGILSYERLLNRGYMLIGGGKVDYINKVVDGSSLTVLLFTSGTTGMSKAVMLSADNICSDVRSIMGIVKINKGERILSILPLHHTYECSITFLCCIYGGVTICFCDGIRHIKKNLEEYRPDILILVPLILEKFYKRIRKAVDKERGGRAKLAVGGALCRAAGIVGLDASSFFFGEIKKAFGGSVRMIITGAAAIDPEIIKSMNNCGIRTFQGYGLTECSPIVICNSDRDNKYDSIGKPIPEVEARLDNCDENGVGEICVKGPMVMLGYYKNEEANRAAFDEDGWFHTGDLARTDSHGRYYICGRIKNVIVTTNGKNVYPEELESLLLRDERIKECIVTDGVDDKGNTIVFAKIFPDVKAISAEYGNRNVGEREISKAMVDAVKKLNSQVVSYKMIKRFEIVDKEFPKTTTSKIKR